MTSGRKSCNAGIFENSARHVSCDAGEFYAVFAADCLVLISLRVRSTHVDGEVVTARERVRQGPQRRPQFLYRIVSACMISPVVLVSFVCTSFIPGTNFAPSPLAACHRIQLASTMANVRCGRYECMRPGLKSPGMRQTQ